MGAADSTPERVVLKQARPPSDNLSVTAPPAPRLADDRGDIVLGWLTKLAVFLAVAGVLVFDAVSLALVRIQAQDDATTAARAGVSAWDDGRGDVQKAYLAALDAVADEPEDSIAAESFTLDRDGTVTLTLERTTATFVVEKIAPLRRWVIAEATVTVRPAA